MQRRYLHEAPQRAAHALGEQVEDVRNGRLYWRHVAGPFAGENDVQKCKRDPLRRLWHVGPYSFLGQKRDSLPYVLCTVKDIYLLLTGQTRRGSVLPVCPTDQPFAGRYNQAFRIHLKNILANRKIAGARGDGLLGEQIKCGALGPHNDAKQLQSHGFRCFWVFHPFPPFLTFFVHALVLNVSRAIGMPALTNSAEA